MADIGPKKGNGTMSVKQVVPLALSALFGAVLSTTAHLFVTSERLTRMEAQIDYIVLTNKAEDNRLKALEAGLHKVEVDLTRLVTQIERGRNGGERRQ